jgi:hypothetical protein
MSFVSVSRTRIAVFPSIGFPIFYEVIFKISWFESLGMQPVRARLKSVSRAHEILARRLVSAKRREAKPEAGIKRQVCPAKISSKPKLS